jgi:polysaccharide export outer membrane protein
MDTSRWLAVALLSLSLSFEVAGCAHNFVWVDDLAEKPPERAVERIQSGDVVQVTVWKQEQLSGDYHVRRDGAMTLPLVGDVPVAGLTPSDAAAQVARRLDGIVLDPQVTVAMRQQRAPLVSVIGEVRTPGQLELRQGETILDVLARAGGLTEFASNDGIYVLRPPKERVRFDYTSLIRAEGRGLDFVLRQGDIIVVE